MGGCQLGASATRTQRLKARTAAGWPESAQMASVADLSPAVAARELAGDQCTSRQCVFSEMRSSGVLSGTATPAPVPRYWRTRMVSAVRRAPVDAPRSVRISVAALAIVG